MTDKDPHVEKILSKNPTFEIGDVVKVKSGGPSMVIRAVKRDEVRCEWFDKATVKSHSFLKAQLIHTNPDQTPILNLNLGDNEVPPWERQGGGH